jgi:hypothetical protein
MNVFCFLTFLLSAGIAVGGLPASASFLPPTSCTDLTDAQRTAEADIVGAGEIIDVQCECSQGAPCTKSIKMLNVEKGFAAAILRYTEILTLDFGVNARYCAEREKYAKTEIGKKETYYFKRQGSGVEIVPPRRCAQ